MATDTNKRIEKIERAKKKVIIKRIEDIEKEIYELQEHERAKAQIAELVNERMKLMPEFEKLNKLYPEEEKSGRAFGDPSVELNEPL